MRIASRILALVMLCTAIVPASAPQETKPQETKSSETKVSSGFRMPANVSDLLDACGETLNQLDTHPTQVASANVIKFGWCLGWAQALQERIAEVQMYARFEEMTAKKEGRPPRSYEGPDKDYLSICLPPTNHVPDLIRAIVKGLREAPGPPQLTEPKNGPVKAALKRSYPCPAP
jgi:Rap1a immunity proteins